MSLVPFLNLHAGETAWVFGKGPSLSSFDISTAGPLRVGINDTPAFVPDVRYCFANDGVADWADVYDQGQVLFQPERATHQFDPRGKVACSVVTFRDDWEDDLVLQPREKIAECLQVRRGTLGSALQILHVMGVSRVVLVGIDGGNFHADCHQWRTRLRNDHWKDYNAIRADAIRSAELMGLELQFFNPQGHMETGKITVKMLRTCSADGEHLTAGNSYTLNPSTASSLITLGRAIATGEAPEKATLAPPEKETATLPTAEARKAFKRGKKKSD